MDADVRLLAVHQAIGGTRCEPDAVVCIDARRSPRRPSLPTLRAWAPPTMNLSMRWARGAGDGAWK